ncbi:hypothetical protein [Nocardia aurea]|uniref:Uncharacterized protein n=1 Tax=Nocardia aurea TaxID=2144174 RepID=A0ABV3FZ57_9NOCA
MTGAVLIGTLLMLACFLMVTTRSAQEEQRRSDALRQWAVHHGWQWAAAYPAPWTVRMPGANPHGVGYGFTGIADGRRVTVTEYTHRTRKRRALDEGSTRTVTHHHVVTIVHLDRPHPPVAVAARGVLSAFERAVFGERPVATGNLWFDNRFWIVSRDPGYVRHLIGPDLMAAHIAGVVPLWSVTGNHLVSYSPGRLNHLPAIPTHIAPLLRVASLLGRTDAWST